MGRLSPEIWEQARAEYEVNGKSMRAIAEMFSVAESAVRKQAGRNGWEQGKSAHLVEKKVNAIKDLISAETESAHLPRTLQEAIDRATREQVNADFLLAKFDARLIAKGVVLLDAVSSPDEWEAMTRGRKNVAFKPTTAKDGTTVNVQQAQQVQGPSLNVHFLGASEEEVKTLKE